MHRSWIWIILFLVGVFLVLLGVVSGIAYDRYNARRREQENRPLWDQPTRPTGYHHLPAQKARQP